jgi:hypothetical protein
MVAVIGVPDELRGEIIKVFSLSPSPLRLTPLFLAQTYYMYELIKNAGICGAEGRIRGNR